MKTIFFLSALLVCAISCGKQKQPSPGKAAVQYPHGQSVGQAVSKLIDAAGGTLHMPDNSISLIVPPNAVQEPTTFSIQEVKNVLPGNLSRSFKILPEGLTLNKEVTLKYFFNDLVFASPKTIHLTYQDEKGFFHVPRNTTLDTIAKTLTVTTSHFSDWTIFDYYQVEVDKTIVQPGGVANLKLMEYDLIGDLTNPDADLQLGELKEYDAAYPVNWIKVSGSGELTPDNATCIYQAPDITPQVNPALIAMELTNFLILNPNDPHRDYEYGGKLIVLTSIYTNTDQFVEYTIDGESYLITGDCETGGCFYMEADKFYLKLTRGNNRYVEIKIKNIHGTGIYKYDSESAAIEMCTGWDDANKIYETSYMPCEGCNAAYSPGNIEITKYDQVGGYVEGTFTATVYYKSGQVNPPSKPMTCTFRLRRDR